jgi:hypothetical protein
MHRSVVRSRNAAIRTSRAPDPHKSDCNASRMACLPMNEQVDPQIRPIWEQGRFPVLVRGGPLYPLLVRLPNPDSSSLWFEEISPRYPDFISKYKAWSIPKAWFEPVAKKSILIYTGVYVFQPYKSTEKCSHACRNAAGARCECSCLGRNHGSGTPVGRWHIVAETLAVRFHGRELSCRLLRSPPELVVAPVQ